jgi:hypothetical protein
MLEDQYQKETCRLFTLINGAVCISPESAVQDSNRKAADRIDLLIPVKQWGIEIVLRNGERHSSSRNSDCCVCPRIYNLAR